MYLNKKLITVLLYSLLCTTISFATPKHAAKPVNKASNTDIQITQVPLERNHLQLFLEKIQSSTMQKHNKLLVPDILLIHGVTYSSHQFDLQYQDYSLARYLAKQGARVWLLDITGYGRSAKPSDGFSVNGQYAADDIAAAVSTIFTTEKVHKINLLGWSFGTVSSALMAAQHPTWINTLTLYAPVYHGVGPATLTTSFKPFAIQDAMKIFQKIPGTNNIDAKIIEPHVLAQYLSQCQQYDGGGSPNGGMKDLLQAKTTTLFNPTQLTMPVLIIGGTNDPYIDWNKDIPDIMHALPNPHNKMVKMNGASHILMIEKPYYKAFREAVWKFVTDNQSILSSRN